MFPQLVLVSILFTIQSSDAALDYHSSADLEIATQLWFDGYFDNYSLSQGFREGCSYCEGAFYAEPPPDDILFSPPPPVHPSQKYIIADTVKSSKLGVEDTCNFCNLFQDDTGQFDGTDGANDGGYNLMVVLLLSFLMISSISLIYIVGTRKNEIVASLCRANLFRSARNWGSKSGNSSDNSTTCSRARLPEQCYLETNRTKNLISPIISERVDHKKTSIPSECWAQPGPIIARTIRRIPNEYEIPSSQANSVGASSALYADTNYDGSSRFFSPYSLHTYAEVKDIPESNEQFHVGSNSSAIISESNYNGSMYNDNISRRVPAIHNGSVQMSNLSSTHQLQPGKQVSINQNSHFNVQHTGQTIYERPSNKVQVVITSNQPNQNLFIYEDTLNNVI